MLPFEGVNKSAQVPQIASLSALARPHSQGGGGGGRGASPGFSRTAPGLPRRHPSPSRGSRQSGAPKARSQHQQQQQQQAWPTTAATGGAARTDQRPIMYPSVSSMTNDRAAATINSTATELHQRQQQQRGGATVSPMRHIGRTYISANTTVTDTVAHIEETERKRMALSPARRGGKGASVSPSRGNASAATRLDMSPLRQEHQDQQQQQQQQGGGMSSTILYSPSASKILSSPSQQQQHDLTTPTGSRLLHAHSTHGASLNDLIPDVLPGVDLKSFDINNALPHNSIDACVTPQFKLHVQEVTVSDTTLCTCVVPNFVTLVLRVDDVDIDRALEYRVRMEVPSLFVETPTIDVTSGELRMELVRGTLGSTVGWVSLVDYAAINTGGSVEVSSELPFVVNVKTERTSGGAGGTRGGGGGTASLSRGKAAAVDWRSHAHKTSAPTAGSESLAPLAQTMPAAAPGTIASAQDSAVSQQQQQPPQQQEVSPTRGGGGDVAALREDGFVFAPTNPHALRYDDVFGLRPHAPGKHHQSQKQAASGDADGTPKLTAAEKASAARSAAILIPRYNKFLGFAAISSIEMFKLGYAMLERDKLVGEDAPRHHEEEQEEERPTHFKPVEAEISRITKDSDASDAEKVERLCPLHMRLAQLHIRGGHDGHDDALHHLTTVAKLRRCIAGINSSGSNAPMTLESVLAEQLLDAHAREALKQKRVTNRRNKSRHTPTSSVEAGALASPSPAAAALQLEPQSPSVSPEQVIERLVSYAKSLFVLGVFTKHIGDFDESIAHFTFVTSVLGQVARVQRQTGLDTDDTLQNRAYAQLAEVLLTTGRAKEATKVFEKCLNIAVVLQGGDTPTATNLMHLQGVALLEAGEPHEGIAMHLKALKARRTHADNDDYNSGDPHLQFQLAESLVFVCHAYSTMNSHEEAQPFYREALEMLDGFDVSRSDEYCVRKAALQCVLGAHVVRRLVVAPATHDAGSALAGDGDDDDEDDDDEDEDANDGEEEHGGSKHKLKKKKKSSSFSKTKLSKKDDKSADAAASPSAALLSLEANGDEDSKVDKKTKLDQAINLLLSAQTAVTQRRGFQSIENAVISAEVAAGYLAVHNYDEAHKQLLLAGRVLGASLGPQHVCAGRICVLSSYTHLSETPSKALDLALDAFEVFDASLDPSHHDIAVCLEAVGTVVTLAHDDAEAARVFLHAQRVAHAHLHVAKSVEIEYVLLTHIVGAYARIHCGGLAGEGSAEGDDEIADEDRVHQHEQQEQKKSLHSTSFQYDATRVQNVIETTSLRYPTHHQHQQRYQKAATQQQQNKLPESVFHRLDKRVRRLRVALGDASDAMRPALQDLAEAHFIAGDFARAHHCLSKAIKIADSFNVIFLLGHLFKPASQLSAGDVQERNRMAADRLSTPIAMHFATILFSIGSVFEAQGKFGEAQSTYLQALASLEIAKLSTSIAATLVLQALGRILFSEGNYGDALAYMEKSYNLLLEHHPKATKYVKNAFALVHAVGAEITHRGYILQRNIDSRHRFAVYM